MTRGVAKKTESWPLGQWLREHRGDVSIREAARRAHVSESWWRFVEAGVQRLRGVDVPIQASAETLVAMARAINADIPRTLELGGYDPAAYERRTSGLHGDTESYQQWFAQLPRDAREEVLAELQRLHLDTELKKVRKGRAAG